MSHIDSYPHEVIGLFGPIPVYRPLEDIPPPADNEPQLDFGCSTQQLVIGGGPGEHLGVVLLDPAGAVAHFALESGDFALRDDMQSSLSKISCPWDQMNFAGWAVGDYHRFHSLCTSIALPNPFDPEGDSSLEDWLFLGFGEFIYYAMPQLALNLVEMLRPCHRETGHIRYNNILIIPPGMPVYANGGNAFFKSEHT